MENFVPRVKVFDCQEGYEVDYVVGFFSNRVGIIVVVASCGANMIDVQFVEYVDGNWHLMDSGWAYMPGTIHDMRIACERAQGWLEANAVLLDGFWFRKVS